MAVARGRIHVDHGVECLNLGNRDLAGTEGSFVGHFLWYVLGGGNIDDLTPYSQSRRGKSGGWGVSAWRGWPLVEGRP